MYGLIRFIVKCRIVQSQSVFSVIIKSFSLMYKTEERNYTSSHEQNVINRKQLYRIPLLYLSHCVHFSFQTELFITLFLNSAFY